MSVSSASSSSVEGVLEMAAARADVEQDQEEEEEEEDDDVVVGDDQGFSRDDDDEQNDDDDEPTSVLEAWKQVHHHLTQAVAIARHAVAAKKIQRRFWLEEICANIMPEGKLTATSVWHRPVPPKKKGVGGADAASAASKKRKRKTPAEPKPPKVAKAKPKKEKPAGKKGAGASIGKVLRKPSTGKKSAKNNNSSPRSKPKKIRLSLKLPTKKKREEEEEEEPFVLPAEPETSDSDDDDDDEEQEEAEEVDSDEEGDNNNQGDDDDDEDDDDDDDDEDEEDDDDDDDDDDDEQSEGAGLARSYPSHDSFNHASSSPWGGAASHHHQARFTDANPDSPGESYNSPSSPYPGLASATSASATINNNKFTADDHFGLQAGLDDEGFYSTYSGAAGMESTFGTGDDDAEHGLAASGTEDEDDGGYQ